MNIHVLSPSDDSSDVVTALAAAFHDYPVMKYVLASSTDYEKDLHTLIHFFVMARIYKQERILTIKLGERCVGAALVSGPNTAQSSTSLDELREATWIRLGSDAQERYTSFGDAANFHVDDPHIHLNMIGVAPDMQGKGLSAILLDAVHDVSRQDPISNGVSLTTELPDNVSYYRHHGYELLGQSTFGNVYTTYRFFRLNDGE